MNFRVGNGFDVHKLEPGLTMWLGGIVVEHHSGFVAHSDGDVLIHSLCDALLGAAAMGDIGLHFPDTDPTYKGVDSKILLKQCTELIRQKGYKIENVDCTIIAQSPKLRPYIDPMRECLSTTMNLDVKQINIKATTTEYLGFIGRAEGIAVNTTILISY